MPDIDADGPAVTGAVVPWADAHLTVVSAEASRAIGGISRGRGTALRLAAARPCRFARVGGHSAAVLGNDALAGRHPSVDQREPGGEVASGQARRSGAPPVLTTPIRRRH